MIGAAIVLLLALGAAWFFLRPQQATVTPEQAAELVNQATGRLPEQTVVPSPSFNAAVDQPGTNQPAPAEPDDRSAVRRIAAAFAERYGSYSNQGDFENLLDLRAYMTAAFAARTEAVVAENRAKPRPAEYFGVTSRAISTDVQLLDENAGRATVVIKAQRRETGSTAGSERVYYQDLTLTFLNVDGAWKVDTAAWAPR